MFSAFSCVKLRGGVTYPAHVFRRIERISGYLEWNTALPDNGFGKDIECGAHADAKFAAYFTHALLGVFVKSNVD